MMRQIILKLSKNDHSRFKTKCFEQGETMTSVLRRLIYEYSTGEKTLAKNTQGSSKAAQVVLNKLDGTKVVTKIVLLAKYGNFAHFFSDSMNVHVFEYEGQFYEMNNKKIQTVKLHKTRAYSYLMKDHL